MPSSRLRSLRAALPALVLALAALPAAAGVVRVPQDAATIQAAVNLAGTGDVVLISSGTYEETVNITSRVDLTLRGKGKVVLRAPLGVDEVVLVVGSTGIRLVDLRFVGGDDPPGIGSPTGVTALSSRAVHVHDCRFTRVGIGVHVDGGSAAAVTESSFVQCTTGVYLDDTTGGVAARNEFENCTRSVFFLGATACSATENEVDGGTFRAFDVASGSNNLIVDNEVESSAAAVRSLAADTHVLRNSIKKCLSGIEIVGDRALVAGNKVSKVEQFGIRIGASDGVVQGNTIKATGGDGIEVVSADTLVTANAVSKAGDEGISVIGTGNTISFNKVKKSADADIASDLPAQNTFLANKSKTGVVSY